MSAFFFKIFLKTQNIISVIVRRAGLENIIFAAALVIRLVFVFQWSGTPYFSNLNADAYVHDVWAMDIAAGRITGETAFYQSPLYPYLLSAVYKILGHHFWPVYIIQALMDAFSCLFLMKATRMMFNRRTAIMCGIAAAFYIPFIFNTGLLLKETLVVFCVTLFLLLFMKSERTDKSCYSYAWGAVLGAAALSRPNMSVLFVFAALWILFHPHTGITEKNEKTAVIVRRKILPAFLGMLLFIIPSVIHNYAASHDFVIFNYAGGFVFYLGANPYADGTTTYPPWITSAPLQEQKQIYEIAEAETGRKLRPSEVSSFWFREGLKYIRENPKRFFWLTMGKFYLFWNAYEIPDNYDISFIRRHFPTVLTGPLAGYAIIASLGVIGMFLAVKRRRGGILPVLFWPYMLSLMPFIITDRYRIPAAVLLIPAAAYTLNRFYIKLVADAGKILPAMLCSLPFIIIVFLPTPCNQIFAEAAGYADLSCKYAKGGEYIKAVKCFEQAEELEPDAVGESAAVCAAYSYNKLNNTSAFRRVIIRYKGITVPE